MAMHIASDKSDLSDRAHLHEHEGCLVLAGATLLTTTEEC
jgi:hypothetical protein